MRRLEFTDDLLTGIPEIDNQHRELFDRGNAVLFPERGKSTIMSVNDAMYFLIRYVDEHLATEEQMMRYSGYSRLGRHRKQHEQLRKDINDICLLSLNKGLTNGLSSLLYYLFSDWYVCHIAEWDNPFAVYLNNCAAQTCSWFRDRSMSAAVLWHFDKLGNEKLDLRL